MPDCTPGYKVTCTAECEHLGDPDWHIQVDKPAETETELSQGSRGQDT